jgi:hypothetical protein
MAHRQPSPSQILLDDLGKLQEPKTVRHRTPILPDPLGQLFLSPLELSEEPMIRLGFLHGVEVLSKKVLDQGKLEALGVAHLTNDRGNRFQAGQPRCSPPPLPDHQLIAIPMGPDNDRLEDAGMLKGGCELF